MESSELNILETISKDNGNGLHAKRVETIVPMAKTARERKISWEDEKTLKELVREFVPFASYPTILSYVRSLQSWLKKIQ
ncbi:MAG TPA: hypothetical protein VEP90_28415 [Methylomirabilota bacterium]|nr:hypothetical protein [Methylomirabilota bacterium]